MTQGPPSPPAAVDDQASFGMKFAIVIYLLVALIGCSALFLDLWRPSSFVVDWILGTAAGPDVDPTRVMFRSLLFSVVGGAFGGIIFSLLAFNRQVGFRRDFSQRFVWGYFYSPFVASVLGLIAFALVKGGILILSGGADSVEDQNIANLGHLSLGFLAGFGWSTFTEKLGRIITEVFGSASPPEASRSDRTTATTGAREEQRGEPVPPAE